MRNSKGQFVKGHKGYKFWKGKKFSEEHRKKVKENHKGTLGKKFSEETKKKMSEAQKGENNYQWKGGKPRCPECGKRISYKATTCRKHKKKMSIETRQKLSKAHKGEKAGNWKGGITSENYKIRHSLEFRLWREAVFARDNWTCQKCKKSGGRLHPHHIKNFADYPKLRFVINNGITLCNKCHWKFHKIYGKTKNNKKQIKEFLAKP
jgi:5-methylcytosine-specific restriction endonuclease McrA